MQKIWLLILLLGLSACATEVSETPIPRTTSLTGSLIFTELESSELRLVQYDLATGTTTTLFTVPDRAWLSYSHVAPDGNQIVLAYAPAPPEGQIQFGYTDLYLMLREAEAVPRSLNMASVEDEAFFDPVWSADGRYLVYAHLFPDSSNPTGFTNQLERLDNISGEREIITNDAIWPRLSPDSSKLTYVFVHPGTLKNELMVADADGRNPLSLIPPDIFEAIDVPFFSPDGTMVYFSAAQPTTANLFWWERLLGVKTAAAHSLPSDWWRVPMTGGEPELVTNIDEVGLHGTFSPDGQRIAYISYTGIYVMNPDGTNKQQLLSTTALNGLSWVP